MCLEHKRDLVNCLKTLEQWCKLQHDIQEKSLKIAESLLLQTEVAELKAKITKLSCTLRMYRETPMTIDAFKILNNSLDEKITNINYEIADKKALKKAYESLHGTEYDEILRKYLETCHIINKKKKLLDKLGVEDL